MNMLRKLKSIAFPSSVLGLVLLANNVAFASNCFVNGQEVSCDSVGKGIASTLGGLLIFFLIMFAIGILATVFWILMIVHIAKHDVPNKALWIILMVFTGVIGAIIYYFVEKKDFDKKLAASQPVAAAPVTPTAAPVQAPVEPTATVETPAEPVTPIQ